MPGASAGEGGPYRLFEPESDETAVKTEEKAPETGKFLKEIPLWVKKEIISHLFRHVIGGPQFFLGMFKSALGVMPPPASPRPEL